MHGVWRWHGDGGSMHGAWRSHGDGRCMNGVNNDAEYYTGTL